MRSELLKRSIDLTFSVLALLLTLPLLLLLILVVRSTMGPPAIFAQVRPGKHEKLFRLLKLRTMTMDRDANGVLLDDGRRMGKFGRFLRSTSLDELPGLWNVIKGEMSLVGPRPLLVEYLDLYSPYQARRHRVRPGLTGWAQVNGRNAISWDDRLSMDVWYVDNWSFALDLEILLRTFAIVLRREGISADGEATVRRFEGAGK